jgi:chemotaxis protein methyltransferase CheR
MDPSVLDTFKYKLSDEDFGRLSSYIYNELGIKMPYPKKVMLQNRLQKRVVDLKLASFKEYLEFVFSNDSEEGEILKMIDLVTTNKTDFFREASHFDYLTNVVLPEICQEGSPRKTIRIWSAGCSSGEEPYTVAIVMAEFLRNHPGLDFEIFGTDISTRILQKAAMAIYPEERINCIPLELKKKYFLKSKNRENRSVRLSSEIRSRVSFQRMNLMDPYYNVDKEFDIVFCRNVLIYFDRETQQNVINKLALKLRYNGFFFLGHSESTVNMTVSLKQIRPTIFRKI